MRIFKRIADFLRPLPVADVTLGQYGYSDKAGYLRDWPAMTGPSVLEVGRQLRDEGKLTGEYKEFSKTFNSVSEFNLDRRLEEIIGKLQCRFAGMIYVGKEYSLANLIRDLESLRVQWKEGK